MWIDLDSFYLRRVVRTIRIEPGSSADRPLMMLANVIGNSHVNLLCVHVCVCVSMRMGMQDKPCVGKEVVEGD